MATAIYYSTCLAGREIRGIDFSSQLLSWHVADSLLLQCRCRRSCERRVILISLRCTSCVVRDVRPESCGRPDTEHLLRKIQARQFKLYQKWGTASLRVYYCCRRALSQGDRAQQHIAASQVFILSRDRLRQCWWDIQLLIVLINKNCTSGIIAQMLCSYQSRI